MASLGFKTLYLCTDDVIYASFSSEIHQAYSVLLDRLAKLGLDISTQKQVQPPIPVIFRLIPFQRLFPFHQINYRETKSFCQVWDLKTIAIINTVHNKIYWPF